MKFAIADSVADKLESNPDVLAAEVERGPAGDSGDPTITAYVPNRHAERRVQRTLHEYPVYIDLEQADPSDYGY